ncbi:hypothetical protein KM799_14640 [Clostridium tyrobutyricum]|jgi:hypothetical protein|uniref:hypothetical protein n=1 Tax=Clostridium tyrobutyricum TaxID=1519 RepID=UPI0010AB4556|nr:hypothetical protein [Clostridium tyrobutyricum]MBR9648021.1 hypothetical protein [Clostridium tyrobutyricum]MBV4447835.1 hypothetical protein [Clostridium tyrobutyricum]QCH27108.1 hypothetical protein EZN00_00697 [Clostridium tyrobutyricum]
MEGRQLTDINDFLLKGSLYEKFNISTDYIEVLEQLIHPDSNFAIRVYCPKCSQVSVFKKSTTNNKKNYLKNPLDEFSETSTQSSGDQLKLIKEQIKQMRLKREKLDRIKQEYKNFSLKLNCSMDGQELIYYFLLENNTIQKVGQTPSTEELNICEIDKYKTILSEIDLIEYKKALNIFSNGCGIGSFIYLRRIFENLIEQKHKIARVDLKSIWDEERYKKGSVENKIKLLKNYLPSLIVNSDKNLIYEILNKNICELDEETCKHMFVLMKDCILLIIQQNYAKHNMELREREYKQHLNEVTQKLNKTQL